MDTAAYYLAFSQVLGIGPVRFTTLLKNFGTAQAAYEASRKDLEAVIGPTVTKNFFDFKDKFDADKQLTKLQKDHITLLTREHEKYPKQFLNLADPPICLYVKGDVSTIDFDNMLFFGVVGTRRMTPYGEFITRQFTTELVQCGFTIVSGLALGIDGTAHQAALDAGGKTVAFLGCGVNIIYPPQHRYLYNDIIDGNGLVISEFPPDMTVAPGLFISRNRLISGLSKGVMVVEGSKDSGALITGRFAAEQGKEVFSPPVPLNSPFCDAPNILLKQGAKFVTSVDDILEEFNMSRKTISQKNLGSNLKGMEKMLFDVLYQDPKAADELGEACKLPISEVLMYISSLELQGVIKKNMEGKYQVV